MTNLIDPENKSKLVIYTYILIFIGIIIISIFKGIEIFFFMSGFLLIIYLLNPKNYHYISIDDNNIYFNSNIIIPLSNIDICITHYREGKYDSNYIFIVDKYGRFGNFYFYSSLEKLQGIETILISKKILCVRYVIKYENIKEAYKKINKRQVT